MRASCSESRRRRCRSRIAWICLLAVSTTSIAAETEAGAVALTAARTRIESDVTAARAALTVLQTEIRRDRGAAADRLTALHRDLESATAELNARERAKARMTAELDSASRDTAQLRELAGFLDSLFKEYRRAFAARLSAAAQQRFRIALEQADERLRAPVPGERLAAAEPLLTLSRTHIDDTFGGTAFDGTALDMGGRIVKGRFAEIGPLGYFAAADGDLAGLVVHRVGSTRPSVFADLSSTTAAEIRNLVRTGYGRVPVDVTAGDAVRLRETRESLPQHLRRGGMIMVPLLLLALACAGMALYKFVTLLTVRHRGWEERVNTILGALQADRVEEALRLAAALEPPLSAVIQEGIQHRAAPKEHIEEIMYESILAQVPALERLLAPLAVCASAAPLLGLLGTVTGMIHTFRLITVFGTGDARLLSGGISEALVTTEVGLAIAIPTLLIHAYLSRRVRKTIAAAQQAAIMFVNSLKLRRHDVP